MKKIFLALFLVTMMAGCGSTTKYKVITKEGKVYHTKKEPRLNDGDEYVFRNSKGKKVRLLKQNVRAIKEK